MARLSTVFREPVSVQPAPYGLLSPASTVIVDDDPHWQAGFTHLMSDFVKVDVISNENPTLSVNVEDGGGDFSRDYLPFTVRVSFTVSTLGNKPSEIEEYARMYLNAATQKALEREFWTGELQKKIETDTSSTLPNRYLASSNAEVLNPAVGSPVKTKYGLALLEQALGDGGIGERGVIHVTRGVGSALAIKGDKGRIETPIGNFIVAGTGYTGSSPDGADRSGDEAWMYATGPVVVRLGPAEIEQDNKVEAVNIKNNTITYTGFRTGSVTWLNDNHFAVLVDLAQDY